jgi:hypothetical protein
VIDNGAATVGFYQVVGADSELQCLTDFATNVRGGHFYRGGKRLIMVAPCD